MKENNANQISEPRERARQILIRKENKTRVVYAPHEKDAAEWKRLGRRLAQIERTAAANAGTTAVAHGYIAGRNQVTMALPHCGYQYTLSLDISGWYDAIRPEQIAAGIRLAGVAPDEADRLACAACLPGQPPSPRPNELAPRQGLPSSPAAANLAAVELDRAVLAGLAAELTDRWTYTRWADDCVVSTQTHADAERARAVLEREITSRHWTVAAHKTHLQWAGAGRRIITGVAVDDWIHPTRAAKRKLRAYAHRLEAHPRVLHFQRAYKGMTEWCALRLPHALTSQRAVFRNANALRGATPPQNPAPVPRPAPHDAPPAPAAEPEVVVEYFPIRRLRR